MDQTFSVWPNRDLLWKKKKNFSSAKSTKPTTLEIYSPLLNQLSCGGRYRKPSVEFRSYDGRW